MSIDVSFFETTLFSLSSPVPIQGEDDDLSVYTIASPAPTPALILVKPPITQVYFRCQNPPVYSPTSTASLSDPVQNDYLPIALRKGKRQCAHLISLFVSYNHLSSSSCSFIASLDSISLPNTIRETLSHSGLHGTWDLVPLLTGKEVIGCHWVFVVKFNPDGSIVRLKACLVAKGYAQTYDVDYSDNFPLVAKLTFVRMFISLAASYVWDLHRLDIKIAFLYEDL